MAVIGGGAVSVNPGAKPSKPCNQATPSFPVFVKFLLLNLPFLANPAPDPSPSPAQGSSLRSDERQPRGLDGADGQAPSPATKGI